MIKLLFIDSDSDRGNTNPSACKHRLPCLFNNDYTLHHPWFLLNHRKTVVPNTTKRISISALITRYFEKLLWKEGECILARNAPRSQGLGNNNGQGWRYFTTAFTARLSEQHPKCFLARTAYRYGALTFTETSAFLSELLPIRTLIAIIAATSRIGSRIAGLFPMISSLVEAWLRLAWLISKF